jgi:hypothetical protein
MSSLPELLTGDSESLPYRVAGILLLLYAQPLTKIAALQTTAITRVDGETRIALGKEPIPVPEPFASQLNYHLYNRPNQQNRAASMRADRSAVDLLRLWAADQMRGEELLDTGWGAADQSLGVAQPGFEKTGADALAEPGQHARNLGGQPGRK